MNILVALLAIFIVGCVSNSPYVPSVDLGLGYEMPNRVIGENGKVGIFRVQQPLVPEQIFVGYSHVSAIDGRDIGTIDQVEFFVRFPLKLDR